MTQNPLRLSRPWVAALRRFARDRSGATAIEYSLMVSFIAIVIVASVTALGGRLVALFTDTSTAF